MYVANMNCEHCVQTIRKSIQEKESGAEVAADLERHQLVVTLPDGRINAEGLREMLIELGYDVDGAPRRRPTKVE